MQKKKKARTSDHLEAADGGAVPVRRDVVKLNLGARALVTGCKRTCLPDAVRMLLYDVQQTVERSDACRAMPSWYSDPTVAMAMMFVEKFDFKLVAQSDLCMNALELFMRKHGVYLLETELIVEDTKDKHFAVYNAVQGLLRDNQEKVKPQLIEDKDKESKELALKVLQEMWDAKVRLINVYELRSIDGSPVQVEKEDKLKRAREATSDAGDPDAVFSVGDRVHTIGSRGKWLKDVYTITAIGPEGEYLFKGWGEKEAKRLKLA